MAGDDSEEAILVTFNEDMDRKPRGAVFLVLTGAALGVHHHIYKRMEVEFGIRIVPMHVTRRHVRLVSMLSVVVVRSDEAGKDYMLELSCLSGDCLRDKGMGVAMKIDPPGRDGINEPAPKPPHGFRVAITPAPISTICKAPLAEIDGRPGRTKIRESLFVPHELTSNTKLDPSQADFGNPPFRQRW